jgi:DNA-binding MarR family transcriptional regulator
MTTKRKDLTQSPFSTYHIAMKSKAEKDVKLSELDPTTYAGFLVWQTSNNWERFVNSQLLKNSINQSELFHMIGLLWLTKENKTLTQASLSRFVGTTSMNTSKILKKLEVLGYVTREVGTDVRANSILLTVKGRSIVMESARNLQSAETTFYPENGRKELISYLLKLKK